MSVAPKKDQVVIKTEDIYAAARSRSIVMDLISDYLVQDDEISRREEWQSMAVEALDAVRKLFSAIIDEYFQKSRMARPTAEFRPKQS